MDHTGDDEMHLLNLEKDGLDARLAKEIRERLEAEARTEGERQEREREP